MKVFLVVVVLLALYVAVHAAVRALWPWSALAFFGVLLAIFIYLLIRELWQLWRNKE